MHTSVRASGKITWLGVDHIRWAKAFSLDIFMTRFIVFDYVMNSLMI